MKRIFLSLLLSASVGFIVGHASEKPTEPITPSISVAANGFTENKGQFRDQYGNTSPEVLFMADLGGMKIQLRKSGFSYETYTVKPKWVDQATIKYKIMVLLFINKFENLRFNGVFFSFMRSHAYEMLMFDMSLLLDSSMSDRLSIVLLLTSRQRMEKR